MADNVIIYDFGKERTESIRAIMDLLNIIEESEQDFCANPAPLFDMACKEIGRLRKVIEDARNILCPPLGLVGVPQSIIPQMVRTISVPEWKFEQYMKLEAFIYSAVKY